MKKQHFQPEPGSMTINGHKMSWDMKRSKSASAFGLQGSRIFQLELKKDGKTVGIYDRGWKIGCQPAKEDEEAILCLNYLISKFGKEAPRRKKEMGSAE